MSQKKQSGDLYRVIHKEGAHLASSNDTHGAFRGNLLDDDTNKPIGNAEWVKVDEDEYVYDSSYDYQKTRKKEELSPEMQELADLLSEMLAARTILFLEEHVGPRVKKFWHDKIMPTIKEKLDIITGKKKENQFKKVNKKSKMHTTEIAATNVTVPGMFSQKLDEAYKKYVYDMTSEEAQRELLDIFILSAILTAKLIKLSNAHIIKDVGSSGEYLDGKGMIERLASPEYINSINLILENNSSLLEENSATLSDILGRKLILNGLYVPIENDKFKENLIMKVKQKIY